MTDDLSNARKTRADQFELLQGITVAQAFTMVLIVASHIHLVRKLRKLDFQNVVVVINNPES